MTTRIRAAKYGRLLGLKISKGGHEAPPLQGLSTQLHSDRPPID
ncbi:MAG: hypothetical protein AAGC54_06915 [Cyanobacteria bacterium P01_F01_bin.4]